MQSIHQWKAKLSDKSDDNKTKSLDEEIDDEEKNPLKFYNLNFSDNTIELVQMDFFSSFISSPPFHGELRRKMKTDMHKSASEKLNTKHFGDVRQEMLKAFTL